MNREKVDCIMLVDDNRHDNFFHERIIMKNEAAGHVVAVESGRAALEYLQKRFDPGHIHPNIILLDINMPGMDGWEFIEHYRRLDTALQSKMIVVMLTTSENPDDKARALEEGLLADFKTKPLTKEMITDIMSKYYGSDVVQP